MRFSIKTLLILFFLSFLVNIKSFALSIEDLQHQPASQFDLGLMKLKYRFERISRSYTYNGVEYKIENPYVDFSRKDNTFKFSIDVRPVPNDWDTPVCDAFIKKAREAMTNYGDPNDFRSRDGFLLYYLMWGDLFTSQNSSKKEKEKVGKVVSKNATLSVFGAGCSVGKNTVLLGAEYDSLLARMRKRTKSE